LRGVFVRLEIGFTDTRGIINVFVLLETSFTDAGGVKSFLG
ncbi:hypothetical protein A2U01_0082875, partial [Trifolium medium]|nr:hypothetical protein [Trifolium medium]